MNEMFKIFLFEKFKIRTILYLPKKTRLGARDILLHNGSTPLNLSKKTSVRLVVFQSEWNDADRLLWRQAGARHFLALADSIKSIHRTIKDLLKS